MVSRYAILYLCIVALFVSIPSQARSQDLELGAENSVTITENDKVSNSKRYKEFFLDVNQGDRLFFDIKGKNGVEVRTSVELYTPNTNYTQILSKSFEAHQEWLSEPLPACKLRVRIIAMRPYGGLSVFVEKRGSDGTSAKENNNVVITRQELQDKTTAELLARHEQLLEELKMIAQEIARR
ncbi:MAG: hypothetical protein JNK90_02955 [Planctomycetaceae bacterium]|nr:hypothetical protein [Planctomycetaceae bacterium]